MSVGSATEKTTNGVCTSSTRPSSPYDGQMIYETDTNLLRVWIVSDWSRGQLLS